MGSDVRLINAVSSEYKANKVIGEPELALQSLRENQIDSTAVLIERNEFSKIYAS